MNDGTHRPDSLDDLSGVLRAAVEHLKRRPVPEGAMQRALDRAAGSDLHSQRTGLRSRRNLVVGFASAVAACVALGLWFSRPSDLWADVVKAVQAKPWIHGTRQGANPGQSSEFWISASRGSASSRSQEQISFVDDRLQIIYRYEPQKRILYRLPVSTEDLTEGQQILEIFQGLFRGDAELKAGLPGMILKDQKRRQREKDERKWDEYELHFLIPTRPDVDVRMTFVVDAQTHLPHSMTMKSIGGESIECTFDYPENGPADVYALGVPKDARLVDRVPTGDMSRILAGIQAGRDRFDDFHAIVIRDDSPDSSRGPGKPFPMAFLVWKKGKRWRVEAGMPPAAFVRDGFPPNKDKKEWLREACKKASFTTTNVCDGKLVYGGDIPGAGGQRDNFKLLGMADSWFSEATTVMPGTWCYPPTFNAPNDRTEEIVNAKPSEGPPNTILVTSRLLDLRSHDPAITCQFQRFWLDPMRGYAVVRHDTLLVDPAVKPPTDQDGQVLMDQWEQTPNGVWYATRVGRGSLLNGLKTGATWYHFFLYFQSDMPDDLFKPEKRTVLTDRYPAGS
jgi:hypothetical protein